METEDDLLQPSLGRADSPATSIYSAQTGYFASFFGGPLAGAVVALANSHRLKRLEIDWPLGMIGAAATIVPIWWLLRGGNAWLTSHLGSGTQTLVLRALGLGFFALAYGWHRRYYRNMAMLGIKPPPGWPIGLAAVIAGVATNLALAWLLS